MAYMDWNDSTLSTGNAIIDRDHKLLVSYVNKLFDAMKSGKGKEVLGEILAGLTKYTIEHFQREEAIWRAGRYAGYDAHKKEHDDLVGQVADLNKKFAEGNLTLSVKTMDFIKDWLTNHILKSDMTAIKAIS